MRTPLSEALGSRESRVGVIAYIRRKIYIRLTMLGGLLGPLVRFVLVLLEHRLRSHHIPRA